MRCRTAQTWIVAARDGEIDERQRRALDRHLAECGALSPDLAVDRARDLIWLHTAPDTYRLLVLERGWALDDYERWLATSLTAALLPAPVPPPTSS